MDSTTLLTIAIVALSAVLVGVGLYAVVIMRQLQRNLGKLEKILGHVDSITTNIDEHIVKPSSSLAGVLAMLREGTQIVDEIRHLSTDTAATAKVIGSEAKEVAEVIRHEVAPAVAEEVKAVVHDTAQEIRATAHDVAPEVREVVQTTGAEARETLDQVRDDANQVVQETVEETAPSWQDLKSTMEARGVSTEVPRRKFFRRH